MQQGAAEMQPAAACLANKADVLQLPSERNISLFSTATALSSRRMCCSPVAVSSLRTASSCLSLFFYYLMLMLTLAHSFTHSHSLAHRSINGYKQETVVSWDKDYVGGLHRHCCMSTLDMLVWVLSSHSIKICNCSSLLKLKKCCVVIFEIGLLWIALSYNQYTQASLKSQLIDFHAAWRFVEICGWLKRSEINPNINLNT